MQFCHSEGKVTKDVHSISSNVGKWCFSPCSLEMGKQHCWKCNASMRLIILEVFQHVLQRKTLSTVTVLIFHLHNYVLSNSLPRLFLLDTVFFTSCLKLLCRVKRLFHFMPGHLEDPYVIISSPGSQIFSHYPQLS